MSLLGQETLTAERRACRRVCFEARVGPRAADMLLRVTGDIVEGEPA